MTKERETYIMQEMVKDKEIYRLKMRKRTREVDFLDLAILVPQYILCGWVETPARGYQGIAG